MDSPKSADYCDSQDQEKLPSALQFLPPTKMREADPVLRLTHVETLLLLCATRWGRDYLRTNGVYEVVRGAHLEETVDKVCFCLPFEPSFYKYDPGV